MAKIAREAEACVWNERFFEDIMRSEGNHDYDSTSTTAISSVLASYKSRASAIVVLTTSGKTAHIVSKYKPLCPILAVTRFPQAARQMQLFRGITPMLYESAKADPWVQDIDDRVQFAIDFGKKNKFINAGDNVIVITGWKQGAGSSNTMRILSVE